MRQTKVDKLITKAILKRDRHLKEIEDDLEYLDTIKDSIQEMCFVIKYVNEEGEECVGSRYIGNRFVCLGLVEAIRNRLNNDIDLSQWSSDGEESLVND